MPRSTADKITLPADAGNTGAKRVVATMTGSERTSIVLDGS